MACSNLILEKVVEKIKSEIAKGELRGVEDNYRNGVDCERFLMKTIGDCGASHIFSTPGSHSKFDVIAIENKQRGVIFHFIQVKSSSSKDNITKYNDSLNSEMTKLARKIIKTSGIKVIDHSISWARIYNPQNDERKLVDITLIKSSDVTREFYNRINPQADIIDLPKRKNALAKAKVKAKKIYKYAEKQLKQK